MKGLSILFRILAVIGFLFLPKSFNYWKQAGTGRAIYEHVITHNIRLAEAPEQEIEVIRNIASDAGIKHAVLMLLGFNLTALVCLFLSTFIATPVKVNDKLGQYIWPYFIAVVVGLSCLPFGLYKSNPSIQEMSVSFATAGIYWLILGGVPLGIALICRRICIKKMKKQYEQGN